MAGFLDATAARLQHLPASDRPTVVIPSYNGARKLPLLTPLLALLLAREGLPVLIHGTATESTRVLRQKCSQPLVYLRKQLLKIANGEVAFVPTALLSPGLQRLLEVRRVVNLRNPAHSLVKLMNPCVGKSLIVSSYTHPEYAISMAATFALTQANALLLRGTEGEAVADPRRTPTMQAFLERPDLYLAGAPGRPADQPAQPAHATGRSHHRSLYSKCDDRRTARTRPIAQQVAHILQLVESL
ncbi:MAG: DNA-binding protein YbiB [Comamonadaceae bacterium]|uniref:DNA-binding protein YbiB n=1 Tax=Candidatus Skiveiella danica TaxID=3386177 RepID=UPI0039091D6A|nr:DNA-binding protein YbiB [Comamonadaceae bacterium]